ncbi:dihydrolipoamide acetyltransferase family protein [Streptomyces solaniscabiei]|uniref:dihydrolipoamide acetyltransferase family protein n=1 Tax=Streptomyces solaniscabiei TaxID=2683255 RepID=UPI001CE27670|nr:dihydrolipoamide acetyltransferase family protein [Streptomyces solaniscabiei]
MTDTAGRLLEFRMPDVGEGLTEAELLTWYVRPGDTVVDGQTVCEIETAKAVVELPIPFDGVVRELRCAEGETVPVGTVVITVAQTRAPDPSPAPPAREPVLVGYGVAAGPTSRRRRTAVPPPARTAEPGSASGPGPVLAKPPVRKLAKDLGVDLTRVVPSGPQGIILRADVHAAAYTAGTVVAPVPAPASPSVPQEPAPGPDGEPTEPRGTRQPRETRVPVRGVRRATAAAVTASAFSAPHVTEFVTVDVTRTMKLVRDLRREPHFADRRVGPLLLVAKALLVAVERNPEINASWDDGAQEIVRKHYIDLGIAAATPRGLIVPAVKDAHTLSLAELAGALDDLVDAARAGRTSPAALSGGTVTVTNIGVFGVDSGTPILNPGEAAILAVGAIRPRPWVHKGKVVPREVVTLSLSFDHRLVDGELGSKVLADVAAVLERPHRLIAWS